MSREARMPPHGTDLNLLNWPVAGISLGVSVWFHDLWQAMPGPTAVYAFVSALFMLFQMADKLGLVDRFRKRPAVTTENDK